MKPWLKKQWCIPKAGAEFVWHMEDVLDLYTQPHDPAHPVVCMDETSKQMVAEKRMPQPAQPGQPARYDYEYSRRGVSNLFVLCEPLAGWRRIKVTERRTRADWAECIRELVDERYPEAESIKLVMDNLNTHTPVSLYETFEPAEARRILNRLELHYTPKHGSWLNIAEIELSLLSRQCLDRRIPDQETLKSETGAWQEARNAQRNGVDWRFTTDDARIKLKRLYPSL